MGEAPLLSLSGWIFEKQVKNVSEDLNNNKGTRGSSARLLPGIKKYPKTCGAERKAGRKQRERPKS